jgi:hypothetical protein
MGKLECIRIESIFGIPYIYMEIKRQPNYKTYWKKNDSIFYCLIISNIMTWELFIELRKCIHITNLATYEHIKKEWAILWKVETILMACRWNKENLYKGRIKYKVE